MFEKLTTKDYLDALAGEGPRALDWEDKPHRLVYDLCNEVERLSKIKAAAEAVCAFDWSDNDDDAVRTITDLRKTLPSAND